MAPSLLEQTDMTSIIWGAGPLTPSLSIFTIRLPSTMRTGPARWLSPDHTSTWKVVSLKHPYPFIIDSQYSIRRQLHIVNWGYVALHILMCQCQCMCIWTTEYDSVMTLNISSAPVTYGTVWADILSQYGKSNLGHRGILLYRHLRLMYRVGHHIILECCFNPF